MQDFEIEEPINEYLEDQNAERLAIFDNQALLDAAASLPPVPPDPADDDSMLDEMLGRFDGEPIGEPPDVPLTEEDLLNPPDEDYEPPSSEAVEAWSTATIFAQDFGDSPELKIVAPVAHVPAPDDVFPWPGSPKVGDRPVDVFPPPTTNQGITADMLANFTGTDEYHRHGIVSCVLLTDGAKYLQETGAAWLIDLIAIQQLVERVKQEPFQVWTLSINPNNSADVVADDGGTDRGRATLARLHVEHTDFPKELSPFKMYVEDYGKYKIVMLRSER